MEGGVDRTSIFLTDGYPIFPALFIEMTLLFPHQITAALLLNTNQVCFRTLFYRYQPLCPFHTALRAVLCSKA